MSGNKWIKVLACIFMWGSAQMMYALNESQQKAKTDSSYFYTPISEFSHVYRSRKVSSSFPVQVKVKGTSLYVTSKHNQMLPVYKGNGVFFGLFRLNKGTNWISGLPRGTYIINNSKITVS